MSWLMPCLLSVKLKTFLHPTDMNANELADKLEKPMLDNPDCPNFSRTRAFMEQVVAMLRQQANRIDVLEANYKIQKDINEKALEYIAELEKGLQASLNLNRAQNERK